ncbi:TIGR00341 family protein [Candidatus Micrarchaeota archaeon]|nr:TIGR00341 family protein [Candidatus Micrarchaeota archaeon]
MLGPLQELINRHFEPLSDGEKGEVVESLRKGAYPSNDFYLMVTLAAVIATLGIFTDNSVVVIGAMVVAPLMLPVISFSLAGVRGDLAMFNRSLMGEAKGAVLAVVVAIIISYIIPNYELTTEFLLRTKPTLLDLGIAFASGLAGAYAIAKRMDYTLPGIAVSVALIPPLCVAGMSIGLRLGIEYTLGALLLFVANIIAINLAGYLVFWIVGLGPGWYMDEQETRKKIYNSVALMLLVAIPLGWIMWTTFEEKYLMSETRDVLEGQLSGIPNTKITGMSYVLGEGGAWKMVVELESPLVLTSERVEEMEFALTERLHREISLELKITKIESVTSS